MTPTRDASGRFVSRETDEERALIELIRFYTRRRQWSMVRALFFDLGRIWDGAAS